MKIICVGRNYVAHAKELGNELPTEPVVFCKPDSALSRPGWPLFYPDFTSDLHYEGELVIRLNGNCKNVQERFARKYFDQISFGFDFTARDVQQRLKEKGLPWEISKGFDGSAAVGDFLKIDDLGDINDIDFTTKLNGQVVQQGNSSLMIFNFNRIVSYVSRFFTLKKGDLIFTGTPAGVGPLQKEDLLEGYIGDRKLVEVKVK